MNIVNLLDVALLIILCYFRDAAKLYLSFSPLLRFLDQINLSLNSSRGYNFACAQFSQHNSQSLRFKMSHCFSNYFIFSRDNYSRKMTTTRESRISFLRRSSVYYANINININSVYTYAVIVSCISRISHTNRLRRPLV